MLDIAYFYGDISFAGLMSIPEIILTFERSCRNVSESIRCVLQVENVYALIYMFLVCKCSYVWKYFDCDALVLILATYFNNMPIYIP